MDSVTAIRHHYSPGLDLQQMLVPPEGMQQQPSYASAVSLLQYVDQILACVLDLEPDDRRRVLAAAMELV